MIEELARIPADAEPASEFRYRNAVVDPDTLYIAVSQSGETYDVLAAVQELKRKGARVLGVVNVVGSAIAREADGGVYVHAGPEVCVVSTKCFTNTTVAFALLALHLGRTRDLSVRDGKRIIEGLRKLPGQIAEIMEQEAEIQKLADELAEARSMLFIGRVRGYPVAREASLKLKEVSYIHAEAYPASELKHGPLASSSPRCRRSRSSRTTTCWRRTARPWRRSRPAVAGSSRSRTRSRRRPTAPSWSRRTRTSWTRSSWASRSSSSPTTRRRPWAGTSTSRATWRSRSRSSSSPRPGTPRRPDARTDPS